MQKHLAFPRIDLPVPVKRTLPIHYARIVGPGALCELR